jgi:hypothetical protein
VNRGDISAEDLKEKQVGCICLEHTWIYIRLSDMAWLSNCLTFILISQYLLVASTDGWFSYAG